jgi:hypothetical protein
MTQTYRASQRIPGCWLPLEKLENFVFCSGYNTLTLFRNLEQNMQREWYSSSTLPLWSTFRLSVLQTYPPPQPTGYLLSNTRGCNLWQKCSFTNCNICCFLYLINEPNNTDLNLKIYIQWNISTLYFLCYTLWSIPRIKVKFNDSSQYSFFLRYCKVFLVLEVSQQSVNNNVFR